MTLKLSDMLRTSPVGMAGVASDVAFSPTPDITATNVQDAIDEARSEIENIPAMTPIFEAGLL